MRKDLEQFKERKAFLADENRQQALEKRHSKGFRMARENIADLVDKDSFLEVGSLIVAGQSLRKSEEHLIKETPADGLVSGLATINKDLFDKKNTSCAVLAYDYTVLAGTQGGFNHKKTDRLIEMAKKSLSPIVFFVEGGGGRPGDIDFELMTNGGLDVSTFSAYAGLSGKVPRIAIVNGYCFAGNAAIAGCSDVIIATKQSNLGMGGPSMIEGGGLGVFSPTQIGDSNTQYKNGVIDILVEDEAEAVKVAKQYLSYFQGYLKNWQHSDQNQLNDYLPQDRRFVYNIQKLIKLLADQDSMLELRAGFATNVVTAFIRIEGKAVGVYANSTEHLGGAIDSNAADKLSRFMQLCNSFGIPLLALCDTPGFMVGPDCEATAMVRHSARLFTTAANLKVPLLAVILRKAYGLGAMAMCGGSLQNPLFSIAWTTGEFGGMGLEGAVTLGFKKELDAAPNEKARKALYDELVKKAYDKGKALSAARKLEFDEVIEPKQTRQWLAHALNACPKANIEHSDRFVDCW